MLTSRGSRGRQLTAIYGVGVWLGALASGCVVWILSGLLAPVPHSAAVIVVGAAAVAGLGRDLGLLRFQLPENRRLVPERVFDRGPARGALQFGFEMGTGVRTYVPSTAPYVLVIAMAFLADGGVAVFLGASGFAIGRALVPAMRLLVRDEGAWERRAARAGEAGARAGGLVFAILAGLICVS